MKYFLFVKKEKVHKKSLNMFSFSESISKNVWFLRNLLQKDMLFLTSAHAAKRSIIFSSRNKLIIIFLFPFVNFTFKILTSFKAYGTINP
jgi:hypothetical protein